MRKTNVFILLAGLLFSPISTSAKAPEKPKTPIRILMWEGYFDSLSLEAYAERVCQYSGKIELVGYTTAQTFLKRWQSSTPQWDIIIFPDSLYDSIAEDLVDLGNPIHDVSYAYHPASRYQYNEAGYAKNILIFMFGMNALVYNPNHITIDKQTSMSEIVAQAKGKDVTLADDLVEFSNFVAATGSRKKRPLASIETLGKEILDLKQHFSSLSFSNDAADVIIPQATKSDFAFAYLWAGDALYVKQQAGKSAQTKLRFRIHKQLNHLSADLLALTSKRDDAECVARLIAGMRFSDDVQSTSSYFSPYGSVDPSKTSGDFQKLHVAFFKKLAKMRRLPTPKLTEAQRAWSTLKK